MKTLVVTMTQLSSTWWVNYIMTISRRSLRQWTSFTSYKPRRPPRMGRTTICMEKTNCVRTNWAVTIQPTWFLRVKTRLDNDAVNPTDLDNSSLIFFKKAILSRFPHSRRLKWGFSLPDLLLTSWSGKWNSWEIETWNDLLPCKWQQLKRYTTG